MYAVGDFYAGYIGTVTYVNGQSLMAFGHPLDWIGATSEYLCNFRVDAIWADSMEAYKVGSLGAVRGTVLQDRGSGVAARLDRTPAQVPITAHASVTTDATRTADGSSYLTQFWADSSLQLGSSLASLSGLGAHLSGQRLRHAPRQRHDGVDRQGDRRDEPLHGARREPVGRPGRCVFYVCFVRLVLLSVL